MKKFEVKDSTHIVFKVEDLEKYLSSELKGKLGAIMGFVFNGRERDGKSPKNKYYICNVDEPYAKEVLSAIKDGEVGRRG